MWIAEHNPGTRDEGAQNDISVPEGRGHIMDTQVVELFNQFSRSLAKHGAQ